MEYFILNVVCFFWVLGCNESEAMASEGGYQSD